MRRRLMRVTSAASQPIAEDFTIAVIPDTQPELWNLANISGMFQNRLNWLVNNQQALNLKYVVHAGDLHDTDNLIFSSDPAVNPRYINSAAWNIDHFQYHHVSESLRILENANIPFLSCLGNHDTGVVCGGPACPVVAGQTEQSWIEVRNTRTWNLYHPPTRYPGISVFEPGKTDNAYRTFTAGGLKWLVLALELWPRTVAVNWAKTVAQNNPDHNIILLAHSYMNSDGSIYNGNGGYGTNTSQYIFDNLVKLYPNIKFVFCGHTGASAVRTDTGVAGNKVYGMLQCFHDATNNWVRLLKISPSKGTVQSQMYAPKTNSYRTSSGDAFTLTDVQFV